MADDDPFARFVKKDVASAASDDPFARFVRKPEAAPKAGDYRALARKYAVAEGLDPDVFERQINAESSFNPKAHSPVGAMGLGQLMPDTAKELGVTDPWDPDQNLRAAARYLRQRRDTYGGDMVKALASYNGGQGAVDYAHRHGTYRGYGKDETYNYLRTILGSKFSEKNDTREADFRNQTATRPPGPPLIAGMKSAWEAMNKPMVQAAGAAETDPFARYVPTRHAPAPPPLAGPYGGSGAQSHAPAPPSNPDTRGAHLSTFEQRGPLERFTSILEAPAEILPRAMVEGNYGEVFRQYMDDPVAARHRFGLSGTIEAGAKKGNLNALWLKQHPQAAGLLQGATDWFNPGTMIEGKAAGKVLGTSFDLISKSKGGRAMLNAFSPLKGIAVGAGQEGKRAVQAMMTRVASQPAEAQSAALKIFGDLSPQASDDVVHVMQNNLKNVSPETLKDPKAMALVQQRAHLLYDFLDHISQGKVRAGLIPASTVRDYATHFPLGGYFKPRPGNAADQEVQTFLDTLSSGGRGGGMMTRDTTEHIRAENRSLAQAQHAVGEQTYTPQRANMDQWRQAADAARPADGSWPMRPRGIASGDSRVTIPSDLGSKVIKNPDFNHAAALEAFATTGLKNLTIEDALQKLPGTLRRDMTPADFGMKGTYANFRRSASETNEQVMERLLAEHPNAIANAARPKDLRGAPMMRWGELPQALQNTMADSPVLRNSWLSRDFVNYLDKHSTRLYKEPKLWMPTGDDKWSKAKRHALTVFDGYNNTMRAAIVSNPLVHPLWNLTNNTLGQGLPLHEVAGLAARSLFSTLGAGKQVDKVVNFFDKDWAHWVDEAANAGALAEMKYSGTDATKRLASRWKDLSISEKMAKAVTGAQAWNTRLTFGPHGEQAFSTALYRNLIKSGKFPGLKGQQEAAGLVREALGNYSNVDPQAGGLINPSRLLFFYPWLKGNLPFWLRKTVENPRAALTPADMARTNNYLVANPDEQKSPAPDGQWVLGDGTRYTPIVPQRMGYDAFNALSDLHSGEEDKSWRTGAKIVGSHLQPLPRVAWDTAQTMMDSRAHDPHQPQNFNTVFDKKAPGSMIDPRTEKGRQAYGYTAAHLVPVPLIGFPLQDIARQGYDPAQLPHYAMSAAGGGYMSTRASAGESRADNRARSKFERRIQQIDKARKGRAGSSNPMLDAEYQAAREKAYGEYRQRMGDLKKRFSPAPAPASSPSAAGGEDDPFARFVHK